MLIDVLSWTATALSLGGNLLIVRKIRFGFIVWIVSNVFWIAVNLIGEPNAAQVIMFGVYILTNVYGLVNWKRSDDGRKHAESEGESRNVDSD